MATENDKDHPPEHTAEATAVQVPEMTAEKRSLSTMTSGGPKVSSNQMDQFMTGN